MSKDLNHSFTSLPYCYLTRKVPSYYFEAICWIIPKNICCNSGIVQLYTFSYKIAFNVTIMFLYAYSI